MSMLMNLVKNLERYEKLREIQRLEKLANNKNTSRHLRKKILAEIKKLKDKII